MRDPHERDRPQSPLDELFLDGAQKYAHPGLRVRSQRPAETQHGTFCLDVALITPGDRVLGFELDGQAYHEAEHDLWRDAAILAAGHCEGIYRIMGRDLVRDAPRVWFLLARLEPSIVSVSAREVLAQQVGHDWLGTDYGISDIGGYMQFDLKLHEVDFEVGDDEPDPNTLWDIISVGRRTRDTPDAQECIRWLEKYPALRLDAIRQLAAAGGRLPV